ncbi:hypothetical protein BofuT4_uP104530.1 [Botrytis cinerea T4]|uniref:Uncharacterized protein n=1 Tax=Botryotinia fuckeliana (strain T4) TaxID=999810 RepID=G2YAJ6_BOTF4|nr:hypothetical protein BofuT4_uP104530.1 [Botrytis cinerea T4]
MKLSPPGWVLTIITTVTIATLIIDMIDPSNTMKEFSINSPEAIRLISAFQDNWAVYKFGIIFRLAAAGVFWSFGGEWVKLVFVELGTLVLLAGAMGFA